MSEIVTLNFFANSYKFGRLSAVSQPHLHHLYAVDSCGMVSWTPEDPCIGSSSSLSPMCATTLRAQTMQSIALSFSWGWRWPCFDKTPCSFNKITDLHYEKEGFYQNWVNSSLPLKCQSTNHTCRIYHDFVFSNSEYFLYTGLSLVPCRQLSLPGYDTEDGGLLIVWKWLKQSRHQTKFLCADLLHSLISQFLKG